MIQTLTADILLRHSTVIFTQEEKAVFFLSHEYTYGMSSKFVRSSKVQLCRIQKDTGLHS